MTTPISTSDPLSSGVHASGTRPHGLAFSMIYGGVSFAIVSMLAYSIWAFRLVPGEAAMYVTIIAVYIGLSGLALGRLVQEPGGWRRFQLTFALAFLVYAIGWCSFWFGLRGKYYADLWGAAIGLAGLTLILRRAFHSTAGFWKLFLVLFLLHSAGYYLGGVLYGSFRGYTGRLLYGAAHGLGFGAGLGWVLFYCRQSVRDRLSPAGN